MDNYSVIVDDRKYCTQYPTITIGSQQFFIYSNDNAAVGIIPCQTTPPT